MERVETTWKYDVSTSSRTNAVWSGRALTVTGGTAYYGYNAFRGD